MGSTEKSSVFIRDPPRCEEKILKETDESSRAIKDGSTELQKSRNSKNILLFRARKAKRKFLKNIGRQQSVEVLLEGGTKPGGMEMVLASVGETLDFHSNLLSLAESDADDDMAAKSEENKSLTTLSDRKPYTNITEALQKTQEFFMQFGKDLVRDVEKNSEGADINSESSNHGSFLGSRSSSCSGNSETDSCSTKASVRHNHFDDNLTVSWDDFNYHTFKVYAYKGRLAPHTIYSFVEPKNLPKGYVLMKDEKSNLLHFPSKVVSFSVGSKLKNSQKSSKFPIFIFNSNFQNGFYVSLLTFLSIYECTL